MWWVAHVILVSAQVLLVLTLGLRTLDFGVGLDNMRHLCVTSNIFHEQDKFVTNKLIYANSYLRAIFSSTISKSLSTVLSVSKKV